jgi:uncharacterized protein YbaP (TraB family)
MVELASLLPAIASPRLLTVGALSALTLTAAPCQAQEVNSPTESSHFLWQVQSPTNTVYLLGSLHFLDEDHYPLPEVMQTAFAEAEVVVFEADIGGISDAETSALLIDKAQPEPGETLAEVLSPNTYALAAQTASEVGVSMAIFEPFEPWFFSISITALKLMELGFAPEYGIDQHFYERSQAAGKSMQFLETVEEQFDFFDQLSIDEQRQLTEQTLEEIDLVETAFDDMITAWSTGDSDGLEAILMASFEAYPQMQKLLLSDRNRNWLPQIEAFLQADEDYLVIVGALHLVGPDNVLDLLAQQGYSAEQL